MQVACFPSVAQELWVAMTQLARPSGPPDTAVWPDALKAEHPEVRPFLRSLWTEAPPWSPTGIELFTLAALNGLEADSNPQRLLTALPDLLHHSATAATADPPDQVLPDLVAVAEARRQELLSRGLAEEYCRAVRHLWEALRPEWEARGLVTVQEECALLRHRLGRGDDLLSLLPARHIARLEQFQPILYQYLERSRVAVLPSFFATGSHMYTVGETLYVSHGIATDSLVTGAADRAAAVAPRMKAFADPTRLAILALITQVPVSVSDLAVLLGVSQPTVSEHLRMLRRAGLVTAQRRGTRVYYFADSGAIRTLLEQAGNIVLPR